MNGLFITGTDTNCGKTTVALSFIHLLKAQGYQIIGMKPVASGCEFVNRACRNDDALRLQAASSLLMPYEIVNPYVFSSPIAPHLAAAEEARTISKDVIAACYYQLAEKADLVLVEGIGGWLVPLSDDFYVADIPKLLNINVLLVVGIRLGCINHTLLTINAILNRGCTLSGWVANIIDSTMLQQSELITALNEFIPAPYLGLIPHVKNIFDVTETTNYLNKKEILDLYTKLINNENLT